jgi:8-oxo-dGTP pyrophosphatase MutT (NUDIX family)
MLKTQSAGGIVLNIQGQVLVVQQKSNSWSLPKGHVEFGESLLDAAKREIDEEAGITELELIKELGTYSRYKIAKGGQGEDKSELKEITLYLFKTSQNDLAPKDANNPIAKWLEPNQVADLLTHPKDKEFFLEYLAEI